MLIAIFIGMHDYAMCVDGSSGDKALMIDKYVRLAVSIACKGFAFFTKEKLHYDIQAHVLDYPYKKMMYDTLCPIDQLFDDANKHDNPVAQIRALILLCRMPVPDWYSKSYMQGLQALFAICFDEEGNFKDAAGIIDIRLLFKDYCRKAPKTWQDIARISPWWCKNKQPHALQTQYYSLSCTQYNEELLQMIAADRLDDFVYLKYLMQKNGSIAARKIYDYQYAQLFKTPLDELGYKD